MKLTLELPGLRLPNPTNQRVHHMAKHRQSKAQKTEVQLRLSQLTSDTRLQLRFANRVRVTLTRIGRLLDDDNLGPSLKAVTDAVADWLRPGLAPGQADNPEHGLWFIRRQESGSPGLRIELETEE